MHTSDQRSRGKNLQSGEFFPIFTSPTLMENIPCCAMTLNDPILTYRSEGHLGGVADLH